MEKHPFTDICDSGDKQQTNELLEKSIQGLPYTLAFPVRKIIESIENNNFSSALLRTLDFFELSAQYISFLLYIFLENKAKLENSEARTALERIIHKIDFKRPLSFGDWTNEILLPLCLTAAKEIPSNPLVMSLRKYVITPKRNL